MHCIRCIGREARVEFIKVVLPARFKRLHFHPANLVSNLCNNPDGFNFVCSRDSKYLPHFVHS